MTELVTGAAYLTALWVWVRWMRQLWRYYRKHYG
jgi:hypothetical protein